MQRDEEEAIQKEYDRIMGASDQEVSIEEIQRLIERMDREFYKRKGRVYYLRSQKKARKANKLLATVAELGNQKRELICKMNRRKDSSGEKLYRPETTFSCIL